MRFSCGRGSGQDSHWKQVLLRELQVVVIAEPPQDGPGGLVPAPLDEECVQEQETCAADWRGSAEKLHGTPTWRMTFTQAYVLKLQIIQHLKNAFNI